MLSLCRADGRDFLPLIACQDSARELRAKLLPPEVQLDEEILQALKPYELLALLTKSESELDEDQSLDALDSIGKHFSGKLAFALSKRLIVAQQTSDGATVPEI